MKEKKTQVKEDLLTIPEVAKVLRVDASTVRRWILQGLLNAIELPDRNNSKKKSYRIKKSTLDQLVK